MEKDDLEVISELLFEQVWMPAFIQGLRECGYAPVIDDAPADATEQVNTLTGIINGLMNKPIGDTT